MAPTKGPNAYELYKVLANLLGPEKRSFLFAFFTSNILR